MEGFVLGVVHKRRPQEWGGGSSISGHIDSAQIGGGWPSKSGSPHLVPNLSI